MSECSVSECLCCFEVYSLNRLPRILLPCGHTACESCLYQVREPFNSKQVKCPVCRQMAAAPSAAGFAINHAILRAAFLRDSPVRFAASSEIKAKPQSDCGEHQGQSAVLFCKECECLICLRCAHGAHQQHDVVDAATAAPEQRSLIEQRIELVQPSIDKFEARRAKIIEERKRDELARATIAAAIDEGAEQLREAVTRQQQKLKQDLALMAVKKASILALIEQRDQALLSALHAQKQDLLRLRGQDDLAVLSQVKEQALKGCAEAWEVEDECYIAMGRFSSLLRVPRVSDSIEEWGSVFDLPLVYGLSYAQGRVSWNHYGQASAYEGLREGPLEDSKSDFDEAKCVGFRGFLFALFG